MYRNDVCAIFYDNHEYNRLLPLTEKRSIASLPFDCKYRIIDFILSMIKNAGIHSTMMILNENKMASLIDHIGSGREWGLDRAGDYNYFLFIQEILRKKSSGEMYFETIIQYLKRSKSKYTVLIGNKFLCNMNLESVIRTHIEQGRQVTAVYKKIADQDFAKDDKLLTLDDNQKIEGYSEIENNVQFQTKSNLEMEIFVMNTDWLIKILEMGQSEGITSDLEKLIMNEAASVGFGYEYTGFLANIHDISSYYRANLQMLNVNDFNQLVLNFQKIKSHTSRNLPTYMGKNAKISNSQLSSGCRINGEIQHSLLSAKVDVATNSLVENSIIYMDSKIGSNAVVKNAILDKNAIVKDGVKIIGDEHHPIVISKGESVNENRITTK